MWLRMLFCILLVQDAAQEPASQVPASQEGPTETEVKPEPNYLQGPMRVEPVWIGEQRIGVFNSDTPGPRAMTRIQLRLAGERLGEVRRVGRIVFSEVLDDMGNSLIDPERVKPDDETWTARQDRNARLPDAFQQTKWNGDASLADLKFRDLAGAYHSPAEEQYTGKARIIEVFGTWCPNCNDATAYLGELQETYRERGLSILGLAFEMTGDHELDAKQVKRYVDYHDITYPVLVAGISDKAAATKAFPVLDKVRSYPTFIFLDGQNNVKAIYTGFSGPATGEAYEKLREDFERIIEQMLEE